MASRTPLFADAWLAPHFPAIRQRAAKAKKLADWLTGGQSLWDWAQGHHWFGLQSQADGSWVYRDWAPNAAGVSLLVNGKVYPCGATSEGQWEVTLPGGELQGGVDYRVVMKWPGGEGERLPAWGKQCRQDANTLEFYAVVPAPQSAYIWKSPNPVPSAFPRIYEAHVGMATEEPKVGTWREFREKRLGEIAAAGYDTLQLMGVMEHPYYGSFGYHVSSFFAPSSRFGSPDDLRELIDAAHALGLRVVMDLVHSHAVRNEVEGISRYDGTDYQFFHAGARGSHVAWDSRCFDYAKPAVLHFLLSNLRYWLEEFRFDGFRFDGVTSMLYHHHGLGGGFDSYEAFFNDTVDEDAVLYLTLANTLLQQCPSHTAISIAEDVSGMPGLAAPLAECGVGFDYRLAMGLVDCWFRLIKDVPDEAWSMSGLWHELTNHRADERSISYVESHDQALVGGKSFIFEMIDKEMYDAMHLGSASPVVDRGVALHKVARLLTLATAGAGYMTFMGNEFGHPEWIDFPREGNGWCHAKARRQWSLRDDASLRFRGLGALENAMLALVDGPWTESHPRLLKADDGDKVLIFQRGTYLFLVNLHPQISYEDYGVSLVGEAAFVLSTDDAVFGGFGRLAPHQVAVGTNDQGMRFYLPSRTTSVWRLT
jgi:1,4-alpha-glucan branching enzyme